MQSIHMITQEKEVQKLTYTSRQLDTQPLVHVFNFAIINLAIIFTLPTLGAQAFLASGPSIAEKNNDRKS